MDARSAPTRIRPAHLSDEIADIVRSRGSALTYTALPAPIEAEAFAAPSNDCVRLYDAQGGTPPLPRRDNQIQRMRSALFRRGRRPRWDVRSPEADAGAPESRLAERHENAMICPKRKREGLTARELTKCFSERPKRFEQILDRLKTDRKEFQSRREEWQILLNRALSRSAEVAKQESPGIDVQAGQSSLQMHETAQPEQPVRVHSRLTFASGLKRVIALVLTINPDATDLQVCRCLDEDGA
jgi:hypothetical protein